jgi:hypothetical protein
MNRTMVPRMMVTISACCGDIDGNSREDRPDYQSSWRSNSQVQHGHSALAIRRQDCAEAICVPLTSFPTFATRGKCPDSSKKPNFFNHLPRFSLPTHCGFRPLNADFHPFIVKDVSNTRCVNRIEAQKTILRRTLCVARKHEPFGALLAMDTVRRLTVSDFA